jgi:small subunit ribosomal protein S8
MAELLQKQGYIEKVEDVDETAQGTLRLTLKYYIRDGQRTGVIEGIRRVSRPGRRIFAGKDNIPKVSGGYGISILSTNQGLLTGHQCRMRGIGGEVLCEVW